jgi:hypothetical protein
MSVVFHHLGSELHGRPPCWPAVGVGSHGCGGRARGGLESARGRWEGVGRKAGGGGQARTMTDWHGALGHGRQGVARKKVKEKKGRNLVISRLQVDPNSVLRFYG